MFNFGGHNNNVTQPTSALILETQKFHSVAKISCRIFTIQTTIID